MKMMIVVVVMMTDVIPFLYINTYININIIVQIVFFITIKHIACKKSSLSNALLTSHYNILSNIKGTPFSPIPSY